ncbi:MAG: hypothetical protein H0X16_05940 [Chloroflexi bacterium]|nr:hypothetical protein [Chloroflexota bacterium]
MEKKQCPRCKTLIEPMPILYGLPGPEMVLGAQAGKIRLGGCTVEPESADYVCPECDAALPWVRQPGDDDGIEDDALGAYWPGDAGASPRQ